MEPAGQWLARGKIPPRQSNGQPWRPEKHEFLVNSRTDAYKNATVAQLGTLALELGCSLSQLAIAWVARNSRGSTVITGGGASKVAQLTENLGALEVMSKLTKRCSAN
jgi:aryl-alcohol dehydrogenase-like predicted oxidoreductase